MEEGYFELENYGVKLKRLTHDKIEMVRQWRNDPKISQYMFYKEYITPEMQERWFENLDKKCNFYFVIEYRNNDIGLINIKNVNADEKSGESGVFIYNDKYLGTDISYRAHLVMFDYAYNVLNLDYTYSEIQLTNKNAIRFSRFLGATMASINDAINMGIFHITNTNYFSNSNRTRFIKRWNLMYNI